MKNHIHELMNFKIMLVVYFCSKAELNEKIAKKYVAKKSNKHMKKTLIKQIKDKYTYSFPTFDWEMLHTG